MIDARIHRVFGMPRVFNKLMAELVTGHFGGRGCGSRAPEDMLDDCGLYTLTQGKVV